MIPGFERVADPAYVADVGGMPLAEIRARRDECQVLENSVSYVRRVAHGRLDIVGSELAARAAGSDASDVEHLLHRLPGALAEGSRPAGPAQRAPQVLEPAEEVVAPLMAALDAIVGPAELGSLPRLETDDLASAVDQLREFERQISTQRRKLHDVIDQLQAEIGRRYQSGEVSVDTLLN